MAGFGGKTVKTDDPTGVDWNDATANERERVGIAQGVYPRLHDNT